MNIGLLHPSSYASLPMNTHPFFRPLTLTGLLVACIAGAAFADTKTFDGGAGGLGTTLDAADNWNPDGIPVTTDEAVLDNSSITLPAALTIDSNQTFGDLVINSVSLTSLTLTGSADRNITLSGGGGSTAAITAGGALGDLIVLGTDVTGTVSIGNGTGSGDLELTLGADGNFNVVNSSAVLSIIEPIDGAFTITKTGAGALHFFGNASSFSGLVVENGLVGTSRGTGLGSGEVTLGQTGGTNNVTLAISGQSGGTTTIANDINVLAQASGTITISNTTVGDQIAQNNEVSGDIALGYGLTINSNRANRSLTVSGMITGSETLTITGINTTTANVVISGNNATSFTGDVVLSAPLFFEQDSLGQNATGGDITFAASTSLVWRGANTQDLSARIQPIAGGLTATFNTNGNDVTFANGLGGDGGVTKAGLGTLTLDAANSYAGTTTVSAGALLVDGSTAGGAVNVSSGGTLAGTGTIGGVTSVNSGGIISPGNSPGTLTINNNLNINTGSTYVFEGGDLIDVNGILDLNDNWTLSLRTGLADGGSITIFAYDSLAATPDLVPTFDVSQLGFAPSGVLSLTDTGTSIVLNGVQVIPEPSTWALLAFSLTTVMVLRRRRKA